MFWTIDERTFHGKIAFYILAILLVSLAFDIRFINSIFTVVLVLVIFIHPQKRLLLKNIFVNYLFLSLLILFLIQTSGLAYSDDTTEGLEDISRKAGMLPFAFFFCIARLQGNSLRRLIAVFSVSLVIVSFICIAIALADYLKNGDGKVFYYHELVRPFLHHAIFFSFLIFFCLVFWAEQFAGKHAEKIRWPFLMLEVFFLAMILLLSSKLVIALTVLYLLILFSRMLFAGKRKWIRVIFFFSFLFLISIVCITSNPVKERFLDISRGNEMLFAREEFSPDMYINGLQFRLITWRFTYEILNERDAWLLGVGPGDAQQRLNQKYQDTKMYLGEPGQRGGFWGFNCHNAYLQTLLESGLVALIFLMTSVFLLGKRTMKFKNAHSLVFFVSMILFSLVESVLSTQHAIQLFLFLPLLAASVEVAANRNAS